MINIRQEKFFDVRHLTILKLCMSSDDKVLKLLRTKYPEVNDLYKNWKDTIFITGKIAYCTEYDLYLKAKCPEHRKRVNPYLKEPEQIEIDDSLKGF